MNKEIHETLMNCGICRTRGEKPAKEFIGHIPAATKFGEMWCIDWHGPEEGVNELDYYILAVDVATRFLVARVYKQNNGRNTMEFIRDNIVGIYGNFGTMLSDNGSTMICQEVRNYVEGEVGATMITSTVYYPEGNWYGRTHESQRRRQV